MHAGSLLITWNHHSRFHFGFVTFYCPIVRYGTLRFPSLLSADDATARSTRLDNLQTSYYAQSEFEGGPEAWILITTKGPCGAYTFQLLSSAAQVSFHPGWRLLQTGHVHRMIMIAYEGDMRAIIVVFCELKEPKTTKASCQCEETASCVLLMSMTSHRLKRCHIPKAAAVRKVNLIASTQATARMVTHPGASYQVP